MTFVIAHRGNSSAAPENTFASFESAIRAGAKHIECDVQMTRDGRIIVIHDPMLDRTTNRQGDVRNLSLAEVKDADASFPSQFGTTFAPQSVPTLSEVLDFIKGRAQLLVEVKTDSSKPDDDVFERRIAADIVKSGVRVAQDDDTGLAFVSFSTSILERMAGILPDAPRGHVFYRDPEDAILAAAARAKAGFVMPEKGHLAPSLLKRAQDAGLRVATWVCDDAQEFIRLSALGLLGIGTNRPAEMIAASPASA
jgi:glycerophosphoryl diester phosphodiesterase